MIEGNGGLPGGSDWRYASYSQLYNYERARDRKAERGLGEAWAHLLGRAAVALKKSIRDAREIQFWGYKRPSDYHLNHYHESRWIQGRRRSFYRRRGSEIIIGVND